MSRDEVWPRILAAVIALLVVVNFVLEFVAEAVTSLTCGARPQPTGPFSGFWLGLSGDPTALRLDGCVIPVAPIRILDAVAVILVLAAAVIGGAR